MQASPAKARAGAGTPREGSLLREVTQLLRAAAKRIPVGVRTEVQAADVMMSVARAALEAEDRNVARRAAEVALDDGGVVSDAARVLRQAGSAAADVDGMFERALDLDPTSVSSWR